jgi:hypothetical protein
MKRQSEKECLILQAPSRVWLLIVLDVEPEEAEKHPYEQQDEKEAECDRVLRPSGSHCPASSHATASKMIALFTHGDHLVPFAIDRYQVVDSEGNQDQSRPRHPEWLT